MDIKCARVAVLSIDRNRFLLENELKRLGIYCVDLYTDSKDLLPDVLYDVYVVDDFFDSAPDLGTAWVPHIEAIRSVYPKAKIMLMSVFPSDQRLAKQHAVEFFDFRDKVSDFVALVQHLLQAVDEETTHGSFGFNNCAVYWRPVNEEETRCLFGVLDHDGPRLEAVFDREPPMYRDDGQHIGDFLKLLWKQWIAELTEHPVAKNSLPISFGQLISIANFYYVTDLESSLTPALKERYL